MGCLKLTYKRNNATLKVAYSVYGESLKNCTGSYRYGMNGQEKDDEIAEGIYTAEFWEYDSRLGRRWNQDPVDYPWLSPYQTFNNNPIALSDPDGLWPKFSNRRYHLAGNRVGAWFKRNFKMPNIASIYGAISGFFRQLGGGHYGGLHIPQGHNQYDVATISGQNVQPGTHGNTDNVKQAIANDMASKGNTTNFPTSVVGIYGGIWNGDATLNVDGTWSNEGDIEGFASVDGIVSGSGWHSLFMNTGFRGFIQSRYKNPNIGFVDIGSERIPGFNFIDDALGNMFGFLKGLGIANKQTTWFNSTSAIRVVNASYTKHAVDYSFGVKYKYWKRVQSFGSTTQRSKMWRNLHNVTR